MVGRKTVPRCRSAGVELELERSLFFFFDEAARNHYLYVVEHQGKTNKTVVLPQTTVCGSMRSLLIGGKPIVVPQTAAVCGSMRSLGGPPLCRLRTGCGRLRKAWGTELSNFHPGSAPARPDPHVVCSIYAR